MIIKNTIAALIPLALMAGAVFAQGEEEKVSPAKLMLELEEALPRKAPETGQPVAFAHSVNWDKSIEKIGFVLVRANGTKVEPHALFLLGCCLFNSHEIEQAKATFEDLKRRFPKHALCTTATDQRTGKSLVDQGIEDCADELQFRAVNKVRKLPQPELDPASATTLHLTAGRVTIQFYKNVALKHRENFLKLASEGFYDRTRVHKVIPGHIVHMGDPNSKVRDPSRWGKGDPGYVIDNEFSLVSHKRGTITMWRGSGRPSSHGSQFQILLKDQPHLDFVQTPFAEVVEGIEIVETLSRQSRNQYEAPVVDCFLNGITTPKK
ncbi:MAG: peptidylprolyl isomerase [Planctomycetota bacterium]|nr:peptidylprolyl isomerase [Planctomycetota bacterium]